jgi:hypothetical protein
MQVARYNRMHGDALMPTGRLRQAHDPKAGRHESGDELLDEAARFP